MAGEPFQWRMGDVVTLRRPHACGGNRWTVVRVGADIGLRCAGCDRRVLLDRATLQRRLARIEARGEAPHPIIIEALRGEGSSPDP